MAELERDIHESPTAVLRLVLDRQDAMERRIRELEEVLELMNRRHRQPPHENLYGSHALYALDEPRGTIE